jgi:uncharacterized membrane protein YkoI
MNDRTGTSEEAVKDGSRRWGRPAAFAAAGLLAGGVLAGTISASADGSDTTSSTTQSGTHGAADESKPQRADEKLLTGDTADRVRTAALAEYPGATIQRIETDSDGVYEAHLVTADGERVTVEVGEDFAITGTESAPGRGHEPGPADAQAEES